MDFSDFLEVFRKFDDMDSNEINNLIQSMEEIIDRDQMLIEIRDGRDLIFVGDLHGDFKTLLSVIKIFLDENHKHIVFLGDYVDRGFADNQIKTVNALLLLKKFFPEKVFLLKGNHEWKFINAEYGFKEAIFHHLIPILFHRYNELFEKLPIAVNVKTPKIFGVHGGIPVSNGKKPYSLKDIAKIPKKNCFDNEIAQQILWNDPDEKINDIEKNHRGLGYIFGIKPFKKFMNHNNLKYCIRSHEVMKKGNGNCFNGKLITVFSSKSYGRRVKPNILIIDENKRFEFRKIKKEKLY
ncbi:MAG: hypothetical protein GF329_06085 [Candidatus Lokiarchaeota archaeon]|nr:hypothetical protein [Candidatus Lokiarchaeota archaeon]